VNRLFKGFVNFGEVDKTKGEIDKTKELVV